MNTAKEGVRLIAETCHARGIRKVVFSPGSRSAPLVIAFSQIPDIECIVIPDERVAGYFALGMAQQLRETVAVVCTSGTAVLNLLPACCEASYQQVPLLFLTADRPEEAEKLGENQAIDQAEVFQPYAMDKTVDVDNEDLDSITDAIENALYYVSLFKAAARLNIQMDEPLYNLTTDCAPFTIKDYEPDDFGDSILETIEARHTLTEHIAECKRKMIVVGLHTPDASFSKDLAQLASRKDTVVLVESTSNCGINNAIYDFDSCIGMFSKGDKELLSPDIVITLGNQIISKKLKQWLRHNKPKYHWDVRQFQGLLQRDMFLLEGEETTNVSEIHAMECLLEAEEKTESTYATDWADVSAQATKLKADYLQAAPYSDLKAIEKVVATLPENCHVQYGNSTPVRYSNLFEHKNSITVNSNRGASGIDGCLSTAAGAAYVSKELTVCVIGDVSFFYDSNALWNNYLSPNFRIILINNSGGNIFRLIDGPGKVQDFEKFFETKHNLNASHLASMYNIPYYFSDRLETLEEILPSFYASQNGRPAILEIKTNNETSAAVYKQYFEHLRNNR